MATNEEFALWLVTQGALVDIPDLVSVTFDLAMFDRPVVAMFLCLLIHTHTHKKNS